MYSRFMSSPITPLDLTRGKQKGAVFALSLVFFVISLTIVASLKLWLWGQQSGENLLLFNQGTVTDNVVEDSALDELLQPQFSVGSGLQQDTAVLTEKLFEPLRQFYATSDDRLGDVVILESKDEEHSAKVEYELETAAGVATKIFFFYDREGEDRSGDWRGWEPSLLDNTD